MLLQEALRKEVIAEHEQSVKGSKEAVQQMEQIEAEMGIMKNRLEHEKVGAHCIGYIASYLHLNRLSA